ncbi:hypothetical protein WJX73_008597 [Symbiochloris irregularis]|uniref:Pyruvate kinase n=1 Tax=Symbiochloris irregularis TaxID=706552 RepID=A0AAW1NTL0_9CHLO
MPGAHAVNKTHFLKNDDLRSIVEPADPNESAFTATKVIITIGPSCQDVDTLCQLLSAGASCARVDLTWGTLDYHKQSLNNLTEAMRKTRKLCAVMVDTIGRELIINREARLDERGWPVHEGQPIAIAAGHQITITTSDVEANADEGILPISYPKFTSMVEVGDTIFLARYLVTGSDDSSLYLTVDKVTDTDVVCTAKTSAELDGLLTVFHTERSADSLENSQNDLPVLCEADRTSIEALSKDFDIDFVSLSFTRTAEDVGQARSFMQKIGQPSCRIIAKLETRQALFNFPQIAVASDGVVLSRGNLGLDVLPEKMALVQKRMISSCNVLGKPVLLTRVVDTMITAPRPTRAEATDVANAVLDGVDGILLGAETLRGRHPVATVDTILHICKQAEKVFDHHHHFERLMQDAVEAADLEDEPGSARALLHRDTSTRSFADSEGLSIGVSPPVTSKGAQFHTKVPYMSKLESIASSAVRAADKVKAALIIVYTQTGTTASLLSKYRPPMPIMTLVIPRLKSDTLSWKLEGRSAARQCLIERGLLPVLAAPSPSGEMLMEEAVELACNAGLVRPLDHIVIVQMVANSFVVKIITVDGHGDSIQPIRPQSLVDMIKATAGVDDEADVNLENGSVATNTIGGAGNPMVHGSLNRNSSAQIVEPSLRRTSLNLAANGKA